MPTNDFIGFASNGSANIMSQADYAAAAEQGDGVQPGMASSRLANKIWRQGANMAAALGRITAARGYDALDNGDLDALQSSVDDAISVGTFNRMYFSQTSGSYTAPRTGVYRITLKGGGGGGAYRNPSSGTGGGGGEGGTLIFYATLTKNTAYAYTVGAGGSAGDYNGGTPVTNLAGGATTFKIGNSTYSAGGGAAAWGGTLNPVSGLGGSAFTAPASDYIFIRGASGESGQWGTISKPGGSGGGSGGGSCPQNNSDSRKNGVFGGGGAGMGTINTTNLTSGAGGDGYILIEYAG